MSRPVAGGLHIKSLDIAPSGEGDVLPIERVL